MLNCPTIIELLSTSCFKSLTDHFIYFGALMLWSYILITVTSSWWIAPSITMHHLTVSFLAFLTWSLVWIRQYMLSFGCHLLEISSSILTLMWAEVSLLEGSILLGLIFNPVTYFCFLIDEFNHLHHQLIVDKWIFSTTIYLLFPDCCIPSVFLFLRFLSAILVWWLSMTFFYFFFFCFVFCSRFMFVVTISFF